MKRYLAVSCLIVIVLFSISCGKGKSKRTMPSMTPAYMYRDKKPMGTQIAFRLLSSQFLAKPEMASKKINERMNVLAFQQGTSFISIGKTMDLDQEAFETLMGYVARGNELFVAADYFDKRFLDTLSITLGMDSIRTIDNRNVNLGYSRKDTWVQMADTSSFGHTRYGFYYYPFLNTLRSSDSSEVVTVLGLNERGHPNYVAKRFGKGRVFLHCEPVAFTNYFLLSGSNPDYYSMVFSYLNHDAESVYWDDGTHFNKRQDFSALAIFWKNPPLKFALLTALVLMLLYIAFGSKRKRSIVPAAPVNRNESIGFAHTIANLYLQKKDNRNIAIKKINYFLEHVRNNYYISTQSINEDFIRELAGKSGLEEEKVRELADYIDFVNTTPSVTDEELFSINNLVDGFYKR